MQLYSGIISYPVWKINISAKIKGPMIFLVYWPKNHKPAYHQDLNLSLCTRWADLSNRTNQLFWPGIVKSNPTDDIDYKICLFFALEFSY